MQLVDVELLVVEGAGDDDLSVGVTLDVDVVPLETGLTTTVSSLAVAQFLLMTSGVVVVLDVELLVMAVVAFDVLGVLVDGVDVVMLATVVTIIVS